LKTRPDVILMDIIMPKKSGIEATKEILEQLPSTRIIAFSTADQETMAMRAMEAGCCSFMEKPFKGEELVRAIQESLRP
ncbi:MAG: response regulator, partial [Bdellovibrionaceae bacterium]|nr:response regulator [Pseudobdellovibrionaceae bacterium]